MAEITGYVKLNVPVVSATACVFAVEKTPSQTMNVHNAVTLAF